MQQNPFNNNINMPAPLGGPSQPNQLNSFNALQRMNPMQGAQPTQQIPQGMVPQSSQGPNQGQDSDQFDGEHYLTFINNRNLSSELGQKLLKSVFGEDSEHYKQLSKQIEIHNKIMGDMEKVKQLALGNEETAMWGKLPPKVVPTPPPEKHINPPIHDPLSGKMGPLNRSL